MKTKFAVTLLLASVLATAATGALSATNQLTREQVKMDRDTFLSIMRWDETMSVWVLKSGMEPPKGVLSRSEVITMRDMWLSNHRYDEATSSWISMDKPRDMKGMSREQVERETALFLMMYRFDESKSDWVSKGASAR